MTTAPLRSAVQLTPGIVVRARVRTAPARPIGTWTSWTIGMPGADWEEHDEQSIWEEIDDEQLPGLSRHAGQPKATASCATRPFNVRAS